ncbi:MAG TPA: ferrous iron transport protein B [Gemmatimonadales bacterium]
MQPVGNACGCSLDATEVELPGALRVALVGAPNVGKSALFNRLTGRYVTVSNYPGTTVELARGHSELDGVTAEIIDTPGIHSLLPIGEDERVAARLLVSDGAPDVVIHTIDAKNIARSLPMTLQLLELGRPLIVALNMMDEAELLGIRIGAQPLAHRLAVPVIPIVAITGRGIAELRGAIRRAALARTAAVLPPVYANGVGQALQTVRNGLAGHYRVDRTAIAALVLQGDVDTTELVVRTEPDGGRAALALARELASQFDAPAPYRIAIERQRTADVLLEDVVALPGRCESRDSVRDRLGRMLIQPATGIAMLLFVLFVGLYLFVGRFGGGTVVGWLEGTVFDRWVTPFLTNLFAGVSSDALRALFVGDYGLLTLGLRYAIAIILPIVGAFFLFFSVLEDSGYFPRLALLVDRVFKRLGLSGRAVIPVVLGFACDTMATMVTRTLETRRERVLATLLLALAIPCSAQLGVILALTAGQPLVVATWGIAVLGTFLLVGWIGARVLPGASPMFHMELPPLRLPRAGNVLVKTATRMQWYFLEVLPLFLLASVLLWAADRTGALAGLQHAMRPVVAALGLPAQTAGMFIFGFFRRDYGAAGLYDLSRQGLLSPLQLAVASVTLTLFVPCIAQFLMMLRERGVKTAVGMLAFITVFAFGAGFILNTVLRWFW